MKVTHSSTSYLYNSKLFQRVVWGSTRKRDLGLYQYEVTLPSSVLKVTNQREEIYTKNIDPAGPSQDLLDLGINESYVYPSSSSNNEERKSLEVCRISNAPHMFLFKNLLSEEECNSLMQLNKASNEEEKSRGTHRVEMKEAKITEGVKEMRSNCQVGWISNDSNGGNQSLSLKLGRMVGNILLTDQAKQNGWCEALQLVHYNAQGGKFDLHYDGLYRTITVIYYLNGVGNTWFPFATRSTRQIDKKGNLEIEPFTKSQPTTRNEAVQFVKDSSLKPGKHGILAAGTNSKVWDDSYNEENVVRVYKGDAIAFYNYKTSSNNDDEQSDLTNTNLIERDWRSFHAGLPTTSKEGEKWIANHWIHHLPFQEDWKEMETI